MMIVISDIYIFLAFKHLRKNVLFYKAYSQTMKAIDLFLVVLSIAPILSQEILTEEDRFIQQVLTQS